MRKKPFLFYLPGILILIALLVYLLLITVQDDHRWMSQTMKETREQLPDESEADLEYFDTIEEAAFHCDLGEYNVTMIKEKVKLLKDDEHAILFFTNREKDFDCFTVYKFNVKTENSHTYYSNPTNATGFSWGAQKDICKSLKFFYKDTYLTEFVKLELMQNNARQTFNLDPDNTHFFWGLHFDERVKDMKINGVSPTEVIPVTLDDEQAYFWYYEDLDYDSLDNDAPDLEVVFQD